MKILGVSSSPRANGNSDTLLKRALDGAASAGAQTEYLSLRGLAIRGCIECNRCQELGVCAVQDDFQKVFPKLLEADRLIFACPVFFMGVNAQGKILIDRCQCLWSRKYILKQPLFEDGPRDRRGMVIAVGGSKSRKMFDCIRMTMKYYFDVLDMKYTASLFVNHVDDRGEVLEHPTAMDEAWRLGREFADPAPAPDKPTEVELCET